MSNLEMYEHVFKAMAGNEESLQIIDKAFGKSHNLQDLNSLSKTLFNRLSPEDKLKDFNHATEELKSI